MRKYILIILWGSLFCSITAQNHYTLKSCLEKGLENNYYLRIVRNEEQISKNNATIGNAGFLPVVDLKGTYSGSIMNNESKLRENNNVNKETNVFDQVYDVGADLNWTIFQGFKMFSTYKQLKVLELQGETNTRINIEDFVAGLAAEYYNYVCQHIRMKNLLYAVKLSRERLRIVEERYNIGDFSRLDLQQARVDFNADSAKYMKQQELLNSSLISLNRLMARKDLNEKISISDTVINVTRLLSLDALVNATLKNNASLIKAFQDKKLAQINLRIIKSRNYPYMKLNAGYGYTYRKYDIANNIRQSNIGANFGITVGMNIFDGNRKRESKNARIVIDNAELQEKDLLQTLKADISNLWQSYTNNMEMLKLERENLIAARENHEIAYERYLLGNLSGIEMREAQKSLLDAEERILSAEYDTKICEISLLQISGNIMEYLD